MRRKSTQEEVVQGVVGVLDRLVLALLILNANLHHILFNCKNSSELCIKCQSMPFPIS